MKQAVGENAHSWWCESLDFYDVGDDLAGGSTKLFRLSALTRDGTVEDVDPGEDTVMAWNDCRVIIDELGVLSRRHGVTWRLDMEGDLLGHVTPEGADDTLQDSMWHFLESADLDVGEDEAALVVARIREKYPPE